MPYIDITTNQPITKDAEANLKEALGHAIEMIPRKSEHWLMCGFHGEERLWFRGNQESSAYIEVKLFGSIANDTCALFTNEITKIVEKALAISPDRIYVSYFTTPYWGYDGKNF